VRCADSLSMREFLRLSELEGVPDKSWLSRTRSRLPLEVHDQVFIWVLERLAAHGLIKGERIGVDTSTRWKPTRRCARSFGATAAKAIARC
jgi:transposase